MTQMTEYKSGEIIKVCTPDGFKPLKDLRVGSVISDPTTGELQSVTQTHPKGTFPFVRICFEDGTETECSEGHLLYCRETERASKNSVPGYYNKVLETSEMHSMVLNGTPLYVPLTAPIEFSRQKEKHPIPPYILGAILGDAYLQSKSFREHNYIEIGKLTPAFRNAASGHYFAGIIADSEERVQRLKTSRYFHGSDECLFLNEKLNGHLKRLGILRKGQISAFVPGEYKYASVEDRKAFMQGFVDYNCGFRNNGDIICETASFSLIKDIASVARSLGCISSSISQKCHGAVAKWQIVIKSNINSELCTSDTKKANVKKWETVPEKRIVSISEDGFQESFCVSE